MRADATRRYHSIDNLRAGMICVVVFGHALLPYVTVPRRFKDPETHVAFDAMVLFLYGFAMPVFFVTAGFAAASLYKRRGAFGLLRNRLLTIFVPLLVAYILLSPLTRAATYFAAEVAGSGSLQAGFDMVRQGGWIHLGKAYHLWFLAALLLFTPAALFLHWAIVGLIGSSKRHVLHATRLLFASRWRPLLLTLGISVVLVPGHTLHNGDAAELLMYATFFAFFVFGWLLYLHRDLLPTFRHNAWQFVAVAVAVLPLAAWSSRIRLLFPDDSAPLVDMVAGISNSILAAFMTFGLLGLFHGRFDQRPSAFGQYISDASYWVYLIHYPLLIAVAGALSATALSAPTKYLITVIVVVPIVLASYHYLVRSTRLGAFLKGRKKTR